MKKKKRLDVSTSMSMCYQNLHQSCAIEWKINLLYAVPHSAESSLEFPVMPAIQVGEDTILVLQSSIGALHVCTGRAQ